MNKKILMGIDGGGTYTRVLITDQNGNKLSHIKHHGGASFHKNPNAIQDVHNAILEALNKAKLQLQDIDIITSGIAGYDKESDLEWVNELTNIEGLTCKKIHLNDAKIAHAGALLGQQGIICIAGTGSIVLGLNEENRYIRNYDFYHNAYGAARLLTYDFMHHVLAFHIDDTDKQIVNELLQHFHVTSIQQLATLGSYGFEKNSTLRDQQFGDFAKNITEAALNGSHLAMQICNQVASNICTGIELVASTIQANNIPYSLIGSVANSKYIQSKIKENLQKSTHHTFTFLSDTLAPEAGAAILGMKELNVELSESFISNLKQFK